MRSIDKVRRHGAIEQASIPWTIFEIEVRKLVLTVASGCFHRENSRLSHTNEYIIHESGVTDQRQRVANRTLVRDLLHNNNPRIKLRGMRYNGRIEACASSQVDGKVGSGCCRVGVQDTVC